MSHVKTSAQKIIFFVLLIDLIGFSIIFPLFPSLLSYYLKYDSSFFLRYTLDVIHGFAAFIGSSSEKTVVVLFGGFLVSIYSFLQFFFSPIFGKLSDRYGRKPLFLISTGGMALSYLVWVFAGNFAILILARIIGGIMSANIATASAAMADITSTENRTKGMALIGIAFGVGFILGPALGGMLSIIDLTLLFPQLIQYGINPFSAPAAFACIITITNTVIIYIFFQETKPQNFRENFEEKNISQTVTRTINPFLMLRNIGYPGVSRTNTVYFLYILVFSGMEFTLTFLAVERFQFSPMQNAFMFVFLGIVSSFVQGGFVRKNASRIGEGKLSISGFLFLIPGFALIGFSENVFMLYIGLLLLSLGSAQILPCLSSLISMYTPAYDQGRILGIFRSLGGLSRTLGPLLGCIIYWKLGATRAYGLWALMLLAPVLILLKLPSISTSDSFQIIKKT